MSSGCITVVSSKWYNLESQGKEITKSEMKNLTANFNYNLVLVFFFVLGFVFLLFCVC
eukprot:c28733_g1_i1 orf=1-171(-)